MSGELIERLRDAKRDGALYLRLEAANEIERLRTELSALRGEGEEDFAAMKAAEKIILRDYELGNLTKIGVANRLRGTGFRLEYACKTAHSLASHPSPDAAVIARLVGALAKRDECVTACPVNSKTWRGGTKPCPSCGDGTGQDCPVMTSADYALMMDLRQALTAAQRQSVSPQGDPRGLKSGG